MGFFPEGVVGGVSSSSGNPFTGVVKSLSVKAKQAMYAASQKGLIRRGTWDGCAFNAAGNTLGHGVSSTSYAATVFEMSPQAVQRFIDVWDQSSNTLDDEQANKYLIEALTEAGLATPPGITRGARIIRGYVYKSEATKFQEQLESGELTVDMIPGCSEAATLLSV